MMKVFQVRDGQQILWKTPFYKVYRAYVDQLVCPDKLIFEVEDA